MKISIDVRHMVVSLAFYLISFVFALAFAYFRHHTVGEACGMLALALVANMMASDAIGDRK